MQTQIHQYTNRLINETSSYLLQHAHNPVEWYPWGEEAFEKARDEDKPLLVSIGYSACHWCHVMEHESFEDEATAEIMNREFVNIKVDMEERPDVDQIYMNFVQITTGRGGWPMNVFLTPDKRPFFGGTYFPPSSRYGMPSWQQILMSIAEAYRERRDELEHSANEIVGELRRMSIVESGGSLSSEILDSALASFSRSFDATHGGFGGAPKFPQAMSLEFLLRYHHRTGDAHALKIVTHTLDKMARGGIYDQLGGGFHRYAVDAIWLVPHFEKMLYDNAQLARIYLHAYQVTGSELFKRIAVETLEYIQREMLDKSGGFYSAQDADSEGEEGKFFVWTSEEVSETLGEQEVRIFNKYYDVTATGNFEGKSILNVKDEAAPQPNIDSMTKLFAEREMRIKPFRDEKILTAWNGLMLAAFADAARVLNDKKYLEIAERNAEFILTELTTGLERTTPSAQSGGHPSFVRRGARLLRTWKEGTAKLNGYLEDYANVADGLIELYQTTGKTDYLVAAKDLADTMITEFWDEEGGGFFFTSNDHEELIVRNKDFYDNATPSGNSAAADVLLRLAKLTGDERYEKFTEMVLKLAASQLRRYPQGFGRTLSAIEFYLDETKEIVIVGEEGNNLARELHKKYLPDAVVVLSSDPESDSTMIPLLKDRSEIDGKATAYICKNFVCERPVTSVEELIELA